MRRNVRLGLGIGVFFFATAGCGGGPAPVDGGADAGAADAGGPDTGPSVCTRDVDCYDSFFCNGLEHCMPGAAGASPQGCLPGSSPCDTSQTCNEGTDHCDSMCAVAEDADGDGHRSVDCGGDDCDDADAMRYPGNGEVCDATNHDEDCDPLTFGNEDLDGDGHVASVCCNVDASSVMHCGDDCDDSNPSVHPGASEVCNMIDDNCNGMIDEMVIALIYLDADGDGFGDPAHTTAGCMAGTIGGMSYVTNSSDCNDTPVSGAMIHPGAAEFCDNVDTDCNPMTFGPGEDDDGDGFVDVMCGGNDCDDTLASVHVGATEICDRLDTDCSSGGGPIPMEDSDGDMHSPLGAPCGGAGGYPKDDCDDTNAAIIPGASRCAAPLSSNSVQVCGADGTWSAATACVAPMPYCDPATAACTAGICGNSIVEAPEACDDANTTNLDGCDDHCRFEPGALRQIEPYSGGYSASTMPFFRVVWPVFAGGGTFQVQRSATRAFTSPVTVPLGAVATSFYEQTATASAALPVGRTWVRVRAIASTGAAGAWSPPWLVSVGHARMDLTGDGNADWVMGERQYQTAAGFVGRVRVYGTNSGAGASIVGVSGATIGDYESHGDFNGDGIEDLVVANPNGGISTSGTVDVYFGGGGGTAFDTALDQQYYPPAAVRGVAALNYGYRASGVGDVNGDGIDDLVTGTGQYGPTASENPAYLVFGTTGAGLAAADTARVLHHADNNVSVWAITGADVNGDGLSDILITGNVTAASGTHHVDRGVLSIIYGNTMVPFDTTVDVTIQGDATAAPNRMGQDVAAADLDRDGYADMVVGATYVDAAVSPMAAPAPSMTSVYVFRGGASLGAGVTSTTRVTGVTGAFGFSVDAGADLNLDGYLDAIVGAPLFLGGGITGSGRAYVFTGGNPLAWVLPLFTYDGTWTNGNAGLCVEMIGRATLGGVSQTLVGVGAPYEQYMAAACRPTPCTPPTYTTAGRFYVIRADGAIHTPQHNVPGSNTAASNGWSTAN